MFEVVTYTYNTTLWVTGRFFKAEWDMRRGIHDPGTFLSGAMAGGLARLATLGIDRGGGKGALQTVCRRMPQFGLLMMFYCPTASHLLPGQEREPSAKMWTTFIIGACAGLNMRFLCNPIARVATECVRTGQRSSDVIRTLKNKSVLHFWYTGPNLLANALYFGVLFTVFEGLRRFTERNVLPLCTTDTAARMAPIAPATVGVNTMDHGDVVPAQPAPHTPADRYITQAQRIYLYTVFAHTMLGGIAAAVATTLCYPYSAHAYVQTVIHNSALCRGFIPTLRKEVPLMALSFGIFSMLQPLLSPRHGVRCGFGY